MTQELNHHHETYAQMPTARIQGMNIKARASKALNNPSTHHPRPMVVRQDLCFEPLGHIAAG